MWSSLKPGSYHHTQEGEVFFDGCGMSCTFLGKQADKKWITWVTIVKTIEVFRFPLSKQWRFLFWSEKIVKFKEKKLKRGQIWEEDEGEKKAEAKCGECRRAHFPLDWFKVCSKLKFLDDPVGLCLRTLCVGQSSLQLFSVVVTEINACGWPEESSVLKDCCWKFKKDG